MDALVDGFGDSGGLFNEFIASGVPQLVNAFAEFGKAKMTATRGLWKIGSGKERSAVGEGENCHWPTTVTVHCLNGIHVDRVDIGSFLAIDLDVDEQPIHEFASGFVFERLMSHDVAPMAGRIADRNENGNVTAFRFGQRFRPPRPPIHGVVGVLAQVRAGFVREAICHGREGIGDEVLRCGHVADPSYRIQ